MEKRIRFTIILVLILIVVIAFSFQSKEKKEYLVYNEALDKTAVTVDDVSLTLKDIAFYVAYEEKTVQEQAILYNPDNPRQYWNVYTDGQFVKLTAKQAALDMAVHDEIFYQMAVMQRSRNILKMMRVISGLILQTGRENNWGFQRKNWILKWRK